MSTKKKTGAKYTSPFGNKEYVYADCTGSGTNDPIINAIIEKNVLPFYANVHSDCFGANYMALLMCRSRHIVKAACTVDPDKYYTIFTGNGMTGAARHFAHLINYDVQHVIYSAYEHLSNSVLWESIFPAATLDVLQLNKSNPYLFNESNLERLIEKSLPIKLHTISEDKEITMNMHRPEIQDNQTHTATEDMTENSELNMHLMSHQHKPSSSFSSKPNTYTNTETATFNYNKPKFTSVPCGKHTILIALTACSNVLGVVQPIPLIATLIDQCRKNYGEHVRLILCVDCATCAPYVSLRSLCDKVDAFFFSPHKMKGGQSTPGVLIIKKTLVCASIPFYPGGGTVWYKDKTIKHQFIRNVELREEGGTPNIIGIIRTGMIMYHQRLILKHIRERTKSLVKFIDHYFTKQDPTFLTKVDMFTPIGKYTSRRLPIYAFRIHQNTHPGLFVKVLSDRYGIQARSGVSCCYLLADVLCKISREERNDILKGRKVTANYGWVRLSFNYEMSDTKIQYVLHSVSELCRNLHEYAPQYVYEVKCNHWKHKYRDVADTSIPQMIEQVFEQIKQMN
uniref:Aminotransferase class V domain-containing protein n=1 Tax=viral metagenome TaxID=1070528 RepID=A0A6C0CRB8_9ZZZZ